MVVLSSGFVSLVVVADSLEVYRHSNDDGDDDDGDGVGVGFEVASEKQGPLVVKSKQSVVPEVS